MEKDQETPSRLPAEDQPDIPGLRSQEGINTNIAGRSGGGYSDTAGRRSGGLSNSTRGAADATNSTNNRGLFNPGGDITSSTGLGSAGLAAAETDPASLSNDNAGFTFSPNSSSTTGGARLRALIGRNPRKVAVGAGVGAGVAGIVVSGFFLLAPLKIEHMITNLQNRSFASSENAVENETQSMLSKYIQRHVLPSYKSCGTTIDKNCSVKNIVGSNPVDNLYKTWANARLENTLATKYGIEFKYDRSSNVWDLKAPGTSSTGDNIGPDGNKLDSEFQRADRATMRNSLKASMADETSWKKMFYRYKVGRLLEEKYGVKRCIMFCGTQDALKDFSDQKKNAAQIFLTQRVLVPRTEALGVVMECLLNPDCHAEETKPTTPENGTSGELAGAPENPETDTAIRTTLTDLAASYGITDKTAVNAMIDDYKNVQENGYQKYLLEKLLSKVGLGDLAGNAIDKAAIVGWVNQASNTVVSLEHAGPNIKKLSYVTNATADVKMFSFYRTYADEIHTGHVDATEVGSVIKTLGSSSSTTGDVVRSSASAEESPLWNKLIHNKSTATKSKNYTCNDDKPLDGDVCPEEKLGGGNATANKLSSELSTPPLSYITQVANAWHGVVGGILGFVGNIFGSVIGIIPGVNSIESFVANAAQPFFKFLTNELVPNPFGDHMHPFTDIAAGADVAGNDAAHNLGAQKVSATVATNITNQQETEARQSFEQQPLFARMFSTDSQYSLISQVAMAMPSDLQDSANTTVASLISSPFSSLVHSFGSLFSSKAAAASDQSDPFNVTQYAYPSGTIPADPGTYWDQHCSDNAAQAYQNDQDYAAHNWNQEAADNPDPETGMPTNNTTNPCLLIKASVGADGGKYDTSLLTQDDLSDLNGGGSGGSGSTPSPSTNPASGNAQQLAQQILNNGNIDLTCYSSSVKPDVEAAAAGRPGTAGAPVSSAILQLIATVGQSHHVCITAIESNGQGHSTGSYHYTGDAVDFGSLDGTTITGRNAPALTIINIAFSTLSSGSALGQSQCGTTPSLPSGWTTFEDTCNHLHVQVPRGTK